MTHVAVRDYIVGRLLTLLAASIASALLMLIYWNIIRKLSQQIFSSTLQQRRRAVMSFVVCVVCMICSYVPVDAYVVVKSFILASNNTEAKEHVMTGAEDLVYSTLATSNSAVNPLIYGIYNKRMRYDLKIYDKIK